MEWLLLIKLCITKEHSNVRQPCVIRRQLYVTKSLDQSQNRQAVSNMEWLLLIKLCITKEHSNAINHILSDGSFHAQLQVQVRSGYFCYSCHLVKCNSLKLYPRPRYTGIFRSSYLTRHGLHLWHTHT